MKNGRLTSYLKYFGLLIVSCNLLVSCRADRAQLSKEETAIVKDSVARTAANIARDISKNGPRAWLNYFEDSPDFYMASGGQLAFKDYQSAKVFILNTLIKTMPHITLQWDHIRVDPLTLELASLGADFHEAIPDSNGKAQNFDGYFSATVHLTDHGWKLKNLHWSFKTAGK